LAGRLAHQRIPFSRTDRALADSNPVAELIANAML
jgi:hypothetical protein